MALIVGPYSAGFGGANRKSPIAIISSNPTKVLTRLGKGDIEVLIEVGSGIDDPGDLDRMVRATNRHLGRSGWGISLALEHRASENAGNK